MSSVLSRALDRGTGQGLARVQLSRARCCFCSAGVVDFTAHSGLARAAATFNSTLDPPSRQRGASSSRLASLHVISLKKLKRTKYLVGPVFTCARVYRILVVPHLTLVICFTSLQSTQTTHLKPLTTQPKSLTIYHHNVSLHARDPPGPGRPQWLRRLPLLQCHHQPPSLRGHERETRRVVQRSSKAASSDSRHPNHWSSCSMLHILTLP